MQALMAFITNAQMVDPKFIINPINPTSKEKNISSKGEISPNMTKLGIHIKISGNGNVFNMKNIWNQDQEQKSRRTKKNKCCDPTIYFSMVISTQVKPQGVTHKWAHLNGIRLQVKDLQCIESKTVMTFFKVSTMTPKEVLLAELRREAQKRASEDLLDTTSVDFTLDDSIELGKSLPPMNLRVQVAMLKGLSVLAFNKLSHHTQHARRSWHL
jgi:hypothetical protein